MAKNTKFLVWVPLPMAEGRGQSSLVNFSSAKGPGFEGLRLQGAHCGLLVCQWKAAQVTATLPMAKGGGGWEGNDS